MVTTTTTTTTTHSLPPSAQLYNCQPSQSVPSKRYLPSPTRVRLPFPLAPQLIRTVFCLRTLREIKLLRWFNHENIISILDIVKPASMDAFTDVYLIQVP